MTHTSNKCGAKNPATCRHHGTPTPTNFNDYAQQRDIEEKIKRSEEVATGMQTLKDNLNKISLKQMDGTLLSMAILHDAETQGIPHDQRLRIQDAIATASYLHRDDTRGQRGELPRDNYITHPLRNALRLQRYYGVKDVSVIIATILHDTVEDHAGDIVRDFVGKDTDNMNEHEKRAEALQYIDNRYGNKIRHIVEAVSNPVIDKTQFTKEQKRALYLEHVTESVADSAEVFMVKFADVYDNGGSLIHSTGSPGMVSHLSRKYEPLMAVFEQHDNYAKTFLTEAGYERFRHHKTTLEKRLLELQN